MVRVRERMQEGGLTMVKLFDKRDEQDLHCRMSPQSVVPTNLGHILPPTSKSLPRRAQLHAP